MNLELHRPFYSMLTNEDRRNLSRTCQRICGTPEHLPCNTEITDEVARILECRRATQPDCR